MGILGYSCLQLPMGCSTVWSSPEHPYHCVLWRLPPPAAPRLVRGYTRKILPWPLVAQCWPMHTVIGAGTGQNLSLFNWVGTELPQTIKGPKPAIYWPAPVRRVLNHCRWTCSHSSCKTGFYHSTGVRWEISIFLMNPSHCSLTPSFLWVLTCIIWHPCSAKTDSCNWQMIRSVFCKCLHFKYIQP